jgi:transcriptional regulator GlxA family with amidase domain
VDEETLGEAMVRYALRCFITESRPAVSQLASDLGVSVRTLHRLTVKYFGCSPGEYLRRIRRYHAAKLLKRSSLTTADVAYRAAYGTRRSLFRDFESTGGTPRGRSKHKGDDSDTSRN